LAFLMEQLLNHQSCLDAWVTPILMKKGRPAHKLHCLCFPQNEHALLELVFRHSTSLGVRIYRNVPRATLDRSILSVQTKFRDTEYDNDGIVRVKVSRFRNGEVLCKKAEFEDCKRVSALATVSMASGVPIQVVAQEAIANAAMTATTTTSINNRSNYYGLL